MPTLLDSLVIAVALDPSKFSEGQRRILKDIAELKASAASSAASVGQSTKTSLHDHLSAIGGELKDVNKQILNLGDATRRSGAGVRSGAESAADGFVVLAERIAVALISLKTLQGIYSGVVTAANRMQVAGRAAWASGIQEQLQEAVANYAYEGPGAVPKDATRNALAAFAQQQSMLTERGIYSPGFQGLAQLGVDFTKSPMEVLRSIAEKLQGKDGPDVRAYLNETPLAPLAQTLAQGPEALVAGIQKAMEFAPTAQQVERATALGEAMRKLDDHLEAFWNIVSDRVNPGLIKFITELTGWVDYYKGLTDKADPPGEPPYFSHGGVFGRIWRSTMPTWMGGNPPGTPSELHPRGTPGPASSTAPPSGAPADLGGQDWAPGQLGALQRAIFGAESGFGTNYNRSPVQGHSASGPMQIIPSTFAANTRPGEDISNYEDNMRVGRRLIAKLWQMYDGDVDKVAYSYANGSPSSPDLNPGYTAKIRQLLSQHPEWMNVPRPAARMPDPRSLTGQPTPGPGAGVVGSGYDPPLPVVLHSEAEYRALIASRAPKTTTTTHATTGPITVHTESAHPLVVGAAVQAAIQNAMAAARPEP
jgi:hypothetical protein